MKNGHRLISAQTRERGERRRGDQASRRADSLSVLSSSASAERLILQRTVSLPSITVIRAVEAKESGIRFLT